MDKKSPSTAQPNTSSSTAAAASPELKVPNGWQKKLIQTTGPYGRTAVVFVSPDGDEIKSRRKLELYMKSNPGGPSVSEFCWSPDDTPRRSLRITESKADESSETETSNKKQKKGDGVKERDSDIEEQKIEVEAKVEESGDNRRRSSRLIKSSPAETPKTETLKKKQQKSISKKEVKVKKTTEEKGAKEESKGSAEVAMEAAADTEQQVNQGQGFKAEAVAGGSELKDAEQKSDQVEDVNKASAAE